MDNFSKAILNELLPVEKLPPAPKGKRARRDGLLDHLAAPILLERAAHLRKLARFSDGSASEVLKEYPQHAIHLLVRSRDGGAELHERFADLFFVIEGRAALVTGGTIADRTTIAPGEIRGSSVEGGARQELRAGDLAHVPAGLPHQMVVSGDRFVTCLVVKIQHAPPKP
jgi:mannose-6-phosphate isomerase-like protein (cupin superfamily)